MRNHSTKSDLRIILRERIQQHGDGSTERWRDVPGYEGLYRISDRGRAKSVTHVVPGCYNTTQIAKGRFLKHKIGHRGHAAVAFCVRLKIKYIGVHRLVLMAFVGPCPPGYECRHLDNNPANNCVDNLRWGSRSENQKDAVRAGTSNTCQQNGEMNPSAKMTNDKVIKLRALYATGKYTKTFLAKRFGISRRTLTEIVENKSWTHLL